MNRARLVPALVVILVAGCGGGGGRGGGGTTPAATAAVPSGATPAPVASGAAAPATSSSPSTPASAFPGKVGTFTRTVTTPARPGLPSITVDYKVHAPPGYDPNRATPLVVSELTPLALWEPVARAEGFLVAEQQGYKGTGAWTYDYDVLVLDELLKDVQATWNVDPARVYLTGFSAGAHWTYVIGLANADRLAGLGVCAGSLAYAIQAGVWPGQVKRAIPVASRHGTQDTVVPVAQGRADAQRLRAAGHLVDYAEVPLGHTVDEAELRALWAFLRDKRRP